MGVDQAGSRRTVNQRARPQPGIERSRHQSNDQHKAGQGEGGLQLKSMALNHPAPGRGPCGMAAYHERQRVQRSRCCPSKQGPQQNHKQAGQQQPQRQGQLHHGRHRGQHGASRRTAQLRSVLLGELGHGINSGRAGDKAPGQTAHRQTVLRA